MNNILIKDIPLNERPRERLVKYGVKNISNEELISIILKTGTKEKSVKELSNMILSKYSDISNLRELEIRDIMKIKGIGKVKAIELIASIELGRRVYIDKNIDELKIKGSIDVYNYFNDLLKDKKQEHFYAVYLDNKKSLKNEENILSQTIINNNEKIPIIFLFFNIYIGKTKK